MFRSLDAFLRCVGLDHLACQLSGLRLDARVAAVHAHADARVRAHTRACNPSSLAYAFICRFTCASASAGLQLDACVGTLERDGGRLALLKRLKELGVAKLPERQQLVTHLAKLGRARRERATCKG